MLLFLIVEVAIAGQIFSSRVMELKGKPYQIELADNNQRRTQGLMHRRSLALDAGMLFVYNRPGDYRIWMKNTRIPLSVIWLDEQARIIQIRQLQPCRVEQCPVSAAPGPSQYILELHPSQSERFKLGDRLAAIQQWAVQK